MPTMTNSLLAPAREVLHKQCHTGELSVPKAPGLDRVATSARAKNKKGPKPREHVQRLSMKRFYSQNCQSEASIALCIECAWGCLVPGDVLLPFHNTVVRTERCAQ